MMRGFGLFLLTLPVAAAVSAVSAQAQYYPAPPPFYRGAPPDAYDNRLPPPGYWTDEDLKPRDRSLLNLGMIACLGRMHEFEAHFRGALNNGLTPKELSAILRQVAIYCGFPAAVDCHRVAKQVLAAYPKKT